MQKNFVIDTNVLIDNPDCIKILRNGEENNIFLPLHVLIELDKLKNDDKIGGSVREAINSIIADKDVIKITWTNESQHEFEKKFDGKILKEITNNSEIKDGILVSNDKILKLISEKIYNYPCEEFNASNPYLTDSEAYTGFCEPEIDVEDRPTNSFTWENGKPTFNGADKKQVISYENTAWKIKPKTVYQNLALELMLNDDIDLITIQSAAGHGKTLLALAAAFQLTFKEKKYKKIYITKTAYELDKDTGFLPGNQDEKFAPIVRPITDLIYELHNRQNCNRLFIDGDPANGFNKKRIEMLPLNYIQGMNLNNCVVIFDEAQNATRKTMRAITTRCGKNTKMFAIGDTRQTINPFVNEHNNGLNWIVKLCSGEKNYGHMVLKGENSRGPITDLMLRCRL